MTEANTISSTVDIKPVESQAPVFLSHTDADMPTEKPYMTIVPTSGWAALHLKETWQFRDLLFTLAGRDLKLWYKHGYDLVAGNRLGIISGDLFNLALPLRRSLPL